MHLLLIICTVCFCTLVLTASAIARHIQADNNAPYQSGTSERERKLPA